MSEKPNLVKVDFNPMDTLQKEFEDKLRDSVVLALEELLEEAKKGNIRHTITFYEQNDGGAYFQSAGLPEEPYRSYYSVANALPAYYADLHLSEGCDEDIDE